MDLEWTTEKRKVNDLVPFPNNPRTITADKKAKLERALKKFNLAEIPAINTDNTIIGGNQRVSILMDIGRGDESIDVRVPNRKLTELEVKEYAIISNTHAGEFDFDIIDEFFSDVDFEDIGFDIPEFEKSKNTIEATEDDYEIPDEIKTDIVLGDVFDIGQHRLMCGDSTNKEDVIKLMDGGKPILMVTDPPYGVSYDADWRNRADRANGKPYGASAIGVVNNDDRIDWSKAYKLFTGSVVYVWHADRHAKEVQQNIEDCGFIIICQIIWAKSGMVISRGDYHWQHEPCWYAVKKGSKHNWGGDRSQTTLWNIDRPMKSESGHSTQKPIECMARPIRNNTYERESVYDPFIGSGTTMVAAHQLNRKCYGMEIDPKYCQVVIDRMLKFDPSIEIKKNGNTYIPISVNP